MKPANNNKLLPSDRTALAKLRLQEKMAAKKKAQENAAAKGRETSSSGSESDSDDSSSDDQSSRRRNTFGSLAEEGDNHKKNNNNNKKNQQPQQKKTAASAKKTPAPAPKKQQQQPAKKVEKEEEKPKKEESEVVEIKKVEEKKEEEKKQEETVAAENEVKKEDEEVVASPVEEKEEAKKPEEQPAASTLAIPKSRSQQEVSKKSQEAIKKILESDDEDEGEVEEKEEDENIVDAYDEFNLVEHHHHKDENKNDDDTQETTKPSSSAEPEKQQQQPEWQDHGVLLSEQEKLEKNPPQHFDYFLLIDFECTCDESPGFDNEIIEIPALLYDTKKLEVVAEYHTYVKPLRNPDLTPFCKQLTGIQQAQVENAPCYDEAVKNLVTFVQTNLEKLSASGDRKTDGSRLCVATDGPCDLEVFGYLFMHVRDAFAFPNFFQRYIDVKQVYRDEYGDGKYYKIKDMLQRFGLRFQGHQHSGIDDTRNLATIVTQMIKRGTVFEEVNYVTNTSGRRRVPAYIWNKAKATVKRAQMTRRVGEGPKMADRCRQGLLGLTEQEIQERTAPFSLATIWSVLRRYAFIRMKVRSSEFVNAPSNVLLVLMFVIFVTSIFYQKASTSSSGDKNNKMILE